MRESGRVVGVALLLLQTRFAGSPDDPLTGLGPLSVAVFVGSSLASKGLSTDRIRTDTELRLRKAGVRVVPDRPTLGTFLHVRLRNACFRRSDYEQCAYAVEVALNEPVGLVRKAGKQLIAETWASSGNTGVVGTELDRQLSSENERGLRDRVADEVDEFINAYVAANPAAPPPTRP